MRVTKCSKVLLMILIVALFSGCSMRKDIYTSVAIIKENNTERNRVIIEDLLIFLQKYYAPAKTTFLITTDNSKENLKFAEQFEDKFRNAGYAISHKKGSNGTLLSWKIDRVGWLIRATYYIGNSVITRVYKSKGSKWVSVGPFSAQNLGSPRYNRALFNELISDRGNEYTVYGKVKVKSLIVRAKPTKKSKIVAHLKYGKRVKIAYKVKNSNNQIWIKLEDLDGYILGNYVKIIGNNYE